MLLQLEPISGIELKIQDKQLILKFNKVSEHAIYDLCSIEGRILLTGKIGSETDLQIDLSAYKNGLYNIYILDDGVIHKEQFILPI